MIIKMLIKEEMKEKNITIAHLKESAGIPETEVNKILATSTIDSDVESRNKEGIKFLDICKLAKVIGTDVDRLYVIEKQEL